MPRDPARPPAPLIAPAPSPEEAAAALAAIERFRADHAPPPPAPDPPSGWLRAARREAVEREPDRAPPA